MAVDPGVCERNLPLLFTLLQSRCPPPPPACVGRACGWTGHAGRQHHASTHPPAHTHTHAHTRLHRARTVEAGLRSNLIIALGDLALRFPNLLEPWTGGSVGGWAGGGEGRAAPPTCEETQRLGRRARAAPRCVFPAPQTPLHTPISAPPEHIYRPLGDPDVAVRKNSLMVLTHLILNDMMKARALPAWRACVACLARVSPRARRCPLPAQPSSAHAPRCTPASATQATHPACPLNTSPPCTHTHPATPPPAGQGPHRQDGCVPGGQRAAHRRAGAALLPRAGQEGVQGGCFSCVV